jgi:hypothetical protein
MLLLASLAWFGYGKFKAADHSASPSAIDSPAGYAPVGQAVGAKTDSSFKCNVRTMGPQMTSCAEAAYFSKHRPNTKMDATMMEFLASGSGATSGIKV